MNWQTLFNPFSKFSEKQLFLFGFFLFIVNILVCFFTKTKMDSIFHFSPQENLTLSSAFLYVTISNASATVFLFLLALIFNTKTRLIDILNTVLISQAPNFIILICIKFSGLETFANNLKTVNGSLPAVDSGSFTSVLLVTGICIILTLITYGFVLLYNGFKTATNLKKWQHTVVFVITVFVFTLLHQGYIQRLPL